jgi:hypothetical protein
MAHSGPSKHDAHLKARAGALFVAAAVTLDIIITTVRVGGLELKSDGEVHLELHGQSFIDWACEQK